MIGKPFDTCPRCGSIHDRSAKSNEWELQTAIRKTKQVMLSAYWGIILGIGGGLAGFVLVLNFFFPETWSALSPAHFGVAASIFALTGMAISFARLRRTIKESRERMKNKGYRYSLVINGFMNADRDMTQENLKDLERISSLFRNRDRR